jgi:CRISPR-associated Cas5-like protein
MLHQTLSKGWCRHGSGLLLGLIVRARRRLVEVRFQVASYRHQDFSGEVRPPYRLAPAAGMLPDNASTWTPRKGA